MTQSLESPSAGAHCSPSMLKSSKCPPTTGWPGPYGQYAE
eukprot:CAMPEP_0172561222 /NCGR_PEP_ID=MMETSP1067-20121228/92063_1 /TAXON_ID=265564 ORGANISM="Thalassiosira punctigera, Strain Tpunct2005C2" /NCGR_SAMPLE_ID=MMETSP1067 /ASSEMBLY_ACC=CAM_ASM_000444 /LENGTH=39 /DNA_ID= /DNA_START= /DNA_END= /DNA_ORIENTATION=